jgi:hypothetical protein
MSLWTISDAVISRPDVPSAVEIFGGQAYQSPSSVWYSCRRNRPPQPSTPLSRIQSAFLLVDQRLLTPLNHLLTFRQDHLNVAWVAHVRVDSAMSSVCATSLFWCLVDLDVLNDQVSSVKALDIGVGLCILKETEKEFGGFDWMTGSRDTELFTCRARMVSC